MQNKMKDLQTYTDFLEEMVETLAESINLTPKDMDKLHSEGEITIQGTKITYKEPKNPLPQDESTK